MYAILYIICQGLRKVLGKGPFPKDRNREHNVKSCSYYYVSILIGSFLFVYVSCGK